MTADLVAVWFGALDGTTWFEQDADVPLYAASLVKVPIATAAAGLDWSEPIALHADFASQAGGRYELDRDDDQDDVTWDALAGRAATATLGELVHRSITVSSNVAANLVLERVGVPAVQAVLREAGVSDRTTFGRGIGDAAAREAGPDNRVTARDLGRVLARTPERVVEVMRAQTYRDGIPAGLAGLAPGADVANKTGWVDGLTHDMALVRADGPDAEPCALVVLTRTGLDHEHAEALVARTAAQAWAHRPVAAR
ncbi:serine hydrolase [Nocardioides marinquilinus]|uniref:Serine hydrolase n=1 Tax=Nocardioides marinquilinus TaxID=1210400 RepID=A0ABP9PR82_9ACTN